MINWFKSLFKTKQVVAEPRLNQSQEKGVLAKVINILKISSISAEVEEQIEDLLLQADVGIKATAEILTELKLFFKENKDISQIENYLKSIIIDRLSKIQAEFQLTAKQTNLILVVGVNGVGKTTTIGKLTNYFKKQNKSIMLAAGDTFRAAAVEQLIAWGQTNKVEVVSQSTGSDSAAVIYDAISSAKSKNKDIIIADTSGRMGAKQNLMQELKKIQQVASKALGKSIDHCLLVLDAGTGQNSIEQVRQFFNIIPITGIILTKVDGSAKAGVILALAAEFDLPIFFIGVGEQKHQLLKYDPEYIYQSIMK